jgi:molybdopterin molybdotransferase
MALVPFDEALGTVVENTPGPDRESVPWAEAAGRVLLEAARAFMDDPPFDRSSMDGFALRSGDTAIPSRFRVLEFVGAGRLPCRAVGPLEAIKVMTGAPIPGGADAVVPVEDCASDGTFAQVHRPVRNGENVRRRGENLRAGELIFEVGRRLDPADVAVSLLAGLAAAEVSRRPGAVFLSTGSELVAPGAVPGPGQVADCNGPMLSGLWRSWGGLVEGQSIVGDDADDLRRAIGAGLAADFLVLSGGVSAGDLDLVPGVLESDGVEILFHKVRMKPGKPVLFGRKGSTVVLGLPGNPVSALVGALLFLQAAFRKRSGLPGLPWREGRLARGNAGGSNRTRFEPCRLGADGGTLHLLHHMGSADLASWREAEAVAEIPWGDAPLPAGSAVRFLPWRRVEEGASA